MSLTKTVFVICIVMALSFALLFSGCVPPSTGQVAQKGETIEDCQNIQDERVDSYDTKLYHSKGLAFFPELTNPVPFCKKYSARGEAVSKIVAGIVPKLGNRILVFDAENGVFTTDMIERGHLGGRWQDSYSITVSEEDGDITVVRVLRTLHIRRSNQFRQHPSDGHNEKWILTQIADNLARKQ